MTNRDSHPRFRALTEHLHDLKERSGTPALAFSLFTPDDVLVEVLLGHRDREAGTPVTPDTRFGVASVTKSFTALTLLAQQAAGRLQLSDPVADHLPLALPQPSRPLVDPWGMEPSDPQLRLSHLLCHASGLPPTPVMTWLRLASDVDDPVAAGDALLEAKRTLAVGAMGVSGEQDWQRVSPAELDAAAERISDDEARARVAEAAQQVGNADGLCAWLSQHATPHARPGAAFSYSNDAFALAGQVVERASGTTFEAEVARAVLQPLGMDRSGFSLPELLGDEDRTTLYTRDAGGVVQRSPAWQETGRMLGGGMLRSTLRDLRHYLRYLMAPESYPAPVPVDQVRDLSRVRIGVGPGRGYGLGLERHQGPDGVTVVTHSGSLKGVFSIVAFDPAAQVGVVGLCNLDGVPVGAIAFPALAAASERPLGDRPYRPPPFVAPRATREAAAAELAGAYRSGEPYGRIRIEAGENGALHAEVGGLRPERTRGFVVRRGEGRLQTGDPATVVTALRDPEGTVAAVRAGSRIWRRTASTPAGR